MRDFIANTSPGFNALETDRYQLQRRSN
jgi:hypothetical protein